MRYAYINGQDSTERRQRLTKLLVEGKLDVLIASTILDEGFDAPAIEFLILAGGGKAGHRQLQRIGRGQRVSEGKRNLFVLDFEDEGTYLTKHVKERVKAYERAEQYNVVRLSRDEFEELISEEESCTDSARQPTE